ncbi:MAG TPA: phosphoribosylformylglycinamidine synthase subunit PurQ [Thermoanaerobaculia bacterium]|nr:phosphoribosylformylglycinamidine synthase subunit PurQ [Thermoanaerobaculia bacterium]HUM29778.1 phosphoribosylformylglycinamidine synthase subunit PurQ [Thermoanaerobaculia bacterium]HXK67078.1 phosphoribosylformylglycinamidine synthase subunit PurQ [Thermoanaerobaculia bacterium]
MKVAVVTFPGSNCDEDVEHVLNHVIGLPAQRIWHREEDLSSYDAIVMPGGFAHGDYLRAGAIARFSPVMNEVIRMARNGFPVIGICNGFQVLLESGLLPGAMLRNAHLKFLCQDVHLRVEQTGTPFTTAYDRNQVIRVPIAHMEGNYFAPPDLIEELEANGQIVFRYVHPDGRREDTAFEANPNGALHSIAGIRNREGNVVGLMPHPERCSESVLGNTDGRKVFDSLLNHLRGDQ